MESTDEEADLDEEAARRLHEHSPERLSSILSNEEVAAEHGRRADRPSRRRDWMKAIGDFLSGILRSGLQKTIATGVSLFILWVLASTGCPVLPR